MTDLWTYLSGTDKPIIMYGMGNGADKIISRLDSIGKTVSDFFASDGFVRGHSFHGKVVLSFDEIKEKYKDFIILISFGSCLDDVLERFYFLDENYEVYAPDVPVCEGETFDLSFFKKHEAEINKARDCFCDGFSKETFDEIINYKLSGKISRLKKTDVESGTEYKDILKKSYEKIVDCGAYTGDTAKEFLSHFSGVKKIICVEPDEKSFRKLSEFAQTENTVIPVNACAWNENGKIFFDKSGNRNSNIFSRISKKCEYVNTLTVDSLTDGKADFIKYDVEGAEYYAINGSQNTIRTSFPDLKIAAYHRSEDIFSLPLLIKEICPDYDLFLRKSKYVPAWEINLFAVKGQ